MSKSKIRAAVGSVACVAVALAGLAMAQPAGGGAGQGGQPGQRGGQAGGGQMGQGRPMAGPLSPAGINSRVLDGNRVTVFYSRPLVRDPKTGEPRKIWGKLVPFGQVWRLGANAATLITNTKPIELGGVAVPAGAHSLYLIPNEDGTAKLVINNQVGQWGTEYDEKQDLGRAELTKAKALENPVDQLTIAVDKGEGTSGALKISWADWEYSVPIVNK